MVLKACVAPALILAHSRSADLFIIIRFSERCIADLKKILTQFKVLELAVFEQLPG